MTKPWLLVALLVGTAIWADLFAHRDELASRRFRELDLRVVSTDLDRSRNKRWHRMGFFQRMMLIVMIAGFVTELEGASWGRVLLSMVVAGCEMALLFDVFFNLRYGVEWWFAGTTAWLDEWLNSLDVGRKFGTAGKLVAGLELAGLVAACVVWLLI